MAMFDGRILDSASLLRRFKRANGLNVTSSANMSGYITLCKVKRILQREFTESLFAKFMTKHQYAQNTKLDRAEKINRLVNRLEKLPPATIRALYRTHEKEGVLAMVEFLNLPMARLLRSDPNLVEQ